MELDLIAQIVLGIGLMTIMFGIGLSLTRQDFVNVVKFPRAVAIGLAAQILGLPLAAVFTLSLFSIPPEYALGLMIIATSPGGATSNLFSYLMRADVALSVSLTAISTLVSLITIPLILAKASEILLQSSRQVALPAEGIFLPLLFLVLVPLLLGMATRARAARWAEKMRRPTATFSIVLLIFTITYVFYLEHVRFFEYIGQLGGVIGLFCLTAASLGLLAARSAGLSLKQQKTVVIEVGIQNGVQAIVIATSPLMFADPVLAVPAAIYSILMYFFAFGLYLAFRLLRL